MSGADEGAEVTLLVIAKEPVPGKAKTRLSPALGERGAAALAEAALADTLAAVAAVMPERPKALALDGSPGPWLGGGFSVFPQRGTGLAERLAAAFEDVGGPAFLIGMDTPQIDPGTIDEACRALSAEGTDAVFGPADHGGWSGLGLRRGHPPAFAGLPMREQASVTTASSTPGPIMSTCSRKKSGMVTCESCDARRSAIWVKKGHPNAT